MLHPSQRHLPLIQQYLTEHETNGVQFLCAMIAKYCPQSTANSVNSETGRPGDTADEDEPAWKKAKQEMLINCKAHQCSIIQGPRITYVSLYFCGSKRFATVVETINRQFPKLSLLAQGLLSVPAIVYRQKECFQLLVWWCKLSVHRWRLRMLIKLFSCTIMIIYSRMVREICLQRN